MKKLVSIMMLIACSVGAWPVQTNRFEVSIGSQFSGRLAIPQGEARVIAVDYVYGGAAVSMTGMTADYLYRAAGATGDWYHIPGTVTNGTALFSWDQTRDAGALQYDGWVRLLSTTTTPVYRARIDIGMIETPGFVVNASAVEASLVDFATLSVTNEPWIAKTAVDGVTVIFSNGVLTAVAAEAPDLTARQSIADHEADITNPHQVTAAQIGALTNASWSTVTGKPFTNLVDLTVLNLTGIDWDLYVTGTPWTAVGYLTDFSTMTTNDITAAGGVVTNGTEYLLIKSQAAAALPETDFIAHTNTLGTAAFTDATDYATLAGENKFTGATNTFEKVVISDTTAATGSVVNADGALVVEGGAHIKKNMIIQSEVESGYSGGNPSGALIVAGGGFFGNAYVLNNLTTANASVTGEATAGSFAYPSNRRSVPSTETISTNAYTIASTNGFDRVLAFGTGITNCTISTTGPGATYNADVRAAFTNYTQAAVTWPDVDYWIPAAPTSNYSVVVLTFDNASGAEIVTGLNITPGE